MKVERQTYANFIRIAPAEYERIHGIIESYGGRIKDCQFIVQQNIFLMFYEMGKSQRTEFEKELGI